MKLWKVLIALFFLGLLLVPALHAQVPFYDYPNSIYYSGNLYPQPYYPPSLYAFDPFFSSPASDSINALTVQMQRLGADVQWLQAQVAMARAQTQLSQARVAAIATLPPGPPARQVVLVLNDGKEITTAGYVISGDTVWILYPTGPMKVSLSELNLAATRKANANRDATSQK
jgi:hypothetical protein